MADREDLGHEPEQTHDKRFAPVTRDEDARGRTVPRDEDRARREDEVSGTGVPGVRRDDDDTLPPDEEGVRAAERGDASRKHPG
jgi:hypothetical protein